MFIFDKLSKVSADVERFDETQGLATNIDQWVIYRGLPEACRDAFFQGDIGGYLVPEEMGGGSYSLFERSVCMEQLTRRAAAMLPFLSEVTDYALLSGLLAGGVDADALRALLPMKGLRPCFSEAYTEPSFFDGVEELTTEVVRDEDGKLVLNGHKTFVPNGEFEDGVLVLAKDTLFGGADGDVSLWMVPLHAEGISAAPVSAIGQALLAPADVLFESVELNPAWRVDSKGCLSVALRRQYELRCLFMAAVDTGLARAAFDDSADFMRTYVSGFSDAHRVASLQDSLLHMRVNVEAMELFVRHAANVLDGPDDRESYFSCKSLMHFVPKNSLEVCEEAMEVMGLRGYSHEMRVGRLLSDCRGNYLRQKGERIMLNVLGSMFD